MWPRIDLLDLLGITHPIIQAPMAGLAPPALAVAVCKAGGLGSLGCAGLSVDEIRDQMQTIRAGTDRPFSVNFLLPSPAPPPAPPDDHDAAAARMGARLAPYYAELSLGAVP